MPAASGSVPLARRARRFDWTGGPFGRRGPAAHHGTNSPPPQRETGRGCGRGPQPSTDRGRSHGFEYSRINDSRRPTGTPGWIQGRPGRAAVSTSWAGRTDITQSADGDPAPLPRTEWPGPQDDSASARPPSPDRPLSSRKLDCHATRNDRPTAAAADGKSPPACRSWVHQFHPRPLPE